VERLSGKDRIYMGIVYFCVTLMALAALYPMVYVLSMSISRPQAVIAREVYLWPVGFSTSAYTRVFQNSAIWRYFGNSFWYTIVGTFFMVVVTVLAAYPISRRKFFIRKSLNKFYIFTLFFSGGLIPFYLIIRSTGLMNNRWALVLPFLVETWNLVIARSFFDTLPEELYEAAKIDGADEFRLMWHIAFPLSRTLFAVLALFYGLANWNGWFFASLLLNDVLHPLQVFLRRVLTAASPEAMMAWAQHGVETTEVLSMIQIQYAIIIVATVPILLLYPFLQRYFEKGVMIGAVKG